MPVAATDTVLLAASAVVPMAPKIEPMVEVSERLVMMIAPKVELTQ